MKGSPKLELMRWKKLRVEAKEMLTECEVVRLILESDARRGCNSL
jgi:hypothetical protein